MTNSDGSLNFDTSINTEGIDEGANDIKAQMDRVVKSFENMGNKITKAIESINMSSVAQEVNKVDTSAKKTEKQIHRTKKALDSLDDVAGPAAIKAQIESDTAALEKLQAQKAEWDDLGVPTDSNYYQKLVADIEELTNSIAFAKSELEELKAEQEQSSVSVDKQATGEMKAALATKELAKAETAANAGSSSLGSKITGLFSGLGTKLSNLSSKFNGLKNIGSKALGAITSHFGKANKASDGLFGRLNRTIKLGSRVMGMMLLFQLFSSGMELVKTQIGGALKQNAEFVASLAAVKGNLQMAFQPIYNAIMPALNAMMAGIRQATIWLASFTHTLFGGTAKSSAAAAQAISAQAGATKSLAKETKKARSELDEFNIISDNSQSGGDSGAGSTQPSYADADKISGNNSFAEKLKEAWSNSDFTGIGQMLADKINDSLNSINWGKVQGTAKKIALCIATFLNGFIGETDWALVGSTFANGLNTALLFAYTFITTFDWAQFGAAIGTGITSFFTNTNWAMLGADISGFVIGLLDMLIAFIDSTDWTAIGTSFGTVLKNIDWATIFQDVWAVICGAFVGLQDIFIGFLTALGMDGVSAEIVTNFALALGGVALALGALNTVLGITSGVLTFLAANPIVLIIGAIALLGVGIYELIKHWDDVVACMQGVGDFIANVFTTDWTTQFGVIGNVLNGFFSVVGDVFGDIKQIFGGIIDFVAGVFTGNWSRAWKGIVDVFGGIFNLIIDIAKAPINLVIGLINGMLNGLESGLNWIVDRVNSLSFNVPDWVPIIGGDHFGFNLPSVSIGNIPYLATGAVIPAASPFVAMLGDQKHGRNLEAPESLIRQIIDEELDKHSNNNNSQQPVVNVQVSMVQDADGTWHMAKQGYIRERDISGVDPILGAI